MRIVFLAEVLELADRHASGACAFYKRAGSTPALSTNSFIMKWTANLAYVIGLITSDGSLSKDGRHLNFTSKDLEQVENFRKILKLKNKIGIKANGTKPIKQYYNLQFGNVQLYRFLLTIGLSPNKSHTLVSVNVPDLYFRDFLRGVFDGDGCTFSYWSPQWPNSFVLYTAITSASKKFLLWLKNKIYELYGIRGYISIIDQEKAYNLRFAKKSSLALFEQMYHNNKVVHLKRKRFKIQRSLDIIQAQAEVAKLVDALA